MFKGDIIQQTPVLLHLFGARNISSSKDPKQHLTGEFLNTKNEIPWISYVKRVENVVFFWENRWTVEIPVKDQRGKNLVVARFAQMGVKVKWRWLISALAFPV